MTTKALTKEEQKKQELMLASMEEEAGAGFENVTTDDVQVPRLTLLQKLSPQLDSDKPEYIEGAKPGQFCISSTGELFDELEIIPCHYFSSVNEWRPNRGGFVASHSKSSDTVLKAERDSEGHLITSEGNELVDTSSYFILYKTASGNWNMAMWSLKMTALKVSRKLMGSLKSFMQPGKNGDFNPPIYSHIVKLTTVKESKDGNTWLNYKTELTKRSFEESMELYEQARQLNKLAKKQLEKNVVMVDSDQDMI